MTRRADMSEPEAIVEVLERRYADFSPKLRKAARFAIDNPEEVAVNSMRALARRAGVHHNTMLRVAREVGFDSYDSFRDRFRKIVIGGRQASWIGRAQSLREHYPEGPNGEVVGRFLYQELANLQEAFGDDNIANLDRAVDLLHGARTIYVLGLRSLFPAAFSFHYTCRMFSNRSTLLTGTGGTFADDLRAVGARDVLLAFSYQPYALDTSKAVTFARKRGARVIAVTDSRVSPIVADESVNFIVNTTSESLFPSLLPALAIVQVLATLLVSRGDSNTLSAISRSQEQLDEFGVYLE